MLLNAEDANHSPQQAKMGLVESDQNRELMD